VINITYFWSRVLGRAFASISNDLLNFATNNVGYNSILRSDGLLYFTGLLEEKVLYLEEVTSR
jgi:hypothetical protein